MKKIFGDYARSFVGGLALGMSSFVPSCVTYDSNHLDTGKTTARRPAISARNELEQSYGEQSDEFGYTSDMYRDAQYRLWRRERADREKCKLSDGRNITVDILGNNEINRKYLVSVIEPGKQIYGWKLIESSGIIFIPRSDTETICKMKGDRNNRSFEAIDSQEEANEETAKYREILRAFDRDFPSEEKTERYGSY